MKSKENRVLELFMNYPKQWHFEDILKKVDISRVQLSYWLKKFEKEKLIKKIKVRGKMPYYITDHENANYKNKKKLFALEKLYESGFLNHVSSLDKAKVVILFGSFSRYDWYKDSDIDIFIYGKDDEFEQGKYELKLKRDIQVHTAENKKDLKKFKTLLPYIVSGNILKGSLNDIGVEISA